jgi:hypothetical protein
MVPRLRIVTRFGRIRRCTPVPLGHPNLSRRRCIVVVRCRRSRRRAFGQRLFCVVRFCGCVVLCLLCFCFVRWFGFGQGLASWRLLGQANCLLARQFLPALVSVWSCVCRRRCSLTCSCCAFSCSSPSWRPLQQRSRHSPLQASRRLQPCPLCLLLGFACLRCFVQQLPSCFRWLIFGLG